MEDIPNYVLYIILFILLIIVLLFVLKYKFNWSFKISIGRKDAEVIKSEVNNSNVTESKDNVTKIDEKDKQEIIDEVVKNVENKIENFRSINEEEIESKSETIDKESKLINDVNNSNQISSDSLDKLIESILKRLKDVYDARLR